MGEELLRAIRAYVRDCARLEDPPRVEELAERLGCTERTLRRRCREELSTSPKQLLLKLQVDLAEKLLTTTDLSTDRIAYQSGFGTRRTLFRAYRAVHGISPKAP